MRRYLALWIASVAPAAALAAGGILLLAPSSARADEAWGFEEAELGVPPEARRVELSLGLDARRLGRHSLELGELDARAPKAAGARAPAAERRDDKALAVSVRSIGELTHRVYLGLHGGLGKARLGELEGLYFEAAGTLALAILDGPLDLRAELLTGVRGVSAERPGGDDWDTEHEALVEPRAAGALRLGPDHSIGAHIGTDLTRRGDLVFGVFVSFRDRVPHVPAL